MKAGGADVPFSLYPLALAEWRCAFVFLCGVQGPAVPDWGLAEPLLTGHTELVVFVQ